MIMAAQALVADFLATFEEFPPAQRPQSFNIDQIIEKMEAAGWPTHDDERLHRPRLLDG